MALHSRLTQDFSWLFSIVLFLFLMGCARVETAAVSTTATVIPTQTVTPTSTRGPTVTPQATQPPPATPTPVATSTAASASPTAVLPTQTQTAVPTPTSEPTATIDPNYEIHIAAVGDIMLDRTLGDIISNGNLSYPFEKMAPWLVPADITVGNFESALGTLGEPIEGKLFPFQSPAEAAEALKLGGFDVVSLANNHALDYGPESLLDGINLLNNAGVLPVGAGESSTAARAPAIIEINGVKLGFLAYVNVLAEANNGFDVAVWEATESEPGLAWGRPEDIAADVERVKPQVDHVIVLLHSGIEYLRFITPEQQDQARTAIDAGATLVVGHHAHILQKVEEYNGGLIAYGLGNFAFDIDGDPSTLVLHAWLNQAGVARFELIPAVVRPGGQPRPATADEAREILAQIGR